MDTNRAQPFRSEIDSIFISSQAYIELAPRYRTFPCRTSWSSAASVSSTGVFASARWIW